MVLVLAASFALGALLGRGASAASAKPWMDSSKPPAQRTDELLAHMSLDEKIAMLHGVSGSPYTGHIPANKRLGIPALNFQDGPAGVGHKMTGVTQLPAPVAGAASWDRAVMRHYGAILGAEQSGQGADVALAPTINIVRDPRWGRAFETLGEDPYLTSQLGVADIQGIQHQGEIAQVKHWDAYNQETHRNTKQDDVLVSRRVLHEIYMPAFKAAIDQGQVGSLMCSYNELHGTFACENPYLLTTVLRKQWGFKGFVTSDWHGTHSTVASAKAGLDMQMPLGTYFGDRLKAAVKSGKVSKTLIDAKVRHILFEMFRFGLFDHPKHGNIKTKVTSPAHARFARRAAEQGTVLLKNKGQILPFGKTIHSIAVIGNDAGQGAKSAGGGSAHVIAPYVVTPYEGIKKRAGKGVTVRYSTGGGDQKGASASAGSNLRQQAVKIARAADVAVVFVNDDESEGKDRTNITLPGDQNQLIEAVAKANSKTIVVLNTGAPVTMPWVKRVAGVIEAWYPGQEDGNAIAAVLFGDVDPSGHLPVTFPQSLKQVPAHTQARWPGVNGKVHYSEGLLVGYRWYDQKHIKPLYPFGYGLSYTHFQMKHLKITPAQSKSGGHVRVSLDIANTGKRAGADVVQLYVGDPAAVGEPPKQLKAFKKIHLKPHAHTRVTFKLDPSAFSYWDSKTRSWKVKNGKYRIKVGDSSKHLPLKGHVSITQMGR
jgi:beta-glucosidase